MGHQALRQIATLCAAHENVVLVYIALDAVVSTLIQSVRIMSHALEAEILGHYFLVVVLHGDHFALQLMLRAIHLFVQAFVSLFRGVILLVIHGGTSVFLFD